LVSHFDFATIFSNFVNPTLIVLAFFIEHQIRRSVLTEVSHKGFFAYVRALARTGLPMSDPGYHARR
jgi:hypothetical protein